MIWFATAALQVLASAMCCRPKFSVPWTEEGGRLIDGWGSRSGALPLCSVQTNHISMDSCLWRARLISVNASATDFQ